MIRIKMKDFFLAIVVLILFAAVISCNNKNTEKKSDTNSAIQSISTHTDTVIIQGMQSQPAKLTINSGDTVLWINKDIVTHNVTEDTAQTWTSGDIVVDSSWRLVPKNDFNYLCSIHPTMKGSVTINK